MVLVLDDEVPHDFEDHEVRELTERDIANFISYAPHSSLLRIADELRASPTARRQLQDLAACM